MKDTGPAPSIRDELTDCLVCQQRHYTPVFDGRVINGHRLLRCRECHTVTAVEALDLVEAAPDYGSYGDYLIHQDRAAIELAVQREAHAKRHLLDPVERRFARPRLLELGSGAGYFCRVAADRGWQAVGVEPSAKLREYCQHEVGFETVVPDLAQVTGSFDVIAMFDVIEHLPPSASTDVLTTLKSRLVAGGYLVGNTPNFGSLNVQLAGPREPVVAPQWHVVYFTPRNLERYLTQFGFRRVRLVTRGFNHTEIDHWCRERGGPVVGRLLGLAARISGKVAGILTAPWGMGYQIHFVFDAPADHP